VESGSFDPASFSGTVPVFPLPNCVLFPGMFLPLHIFEPRYRAMTADALGGERLIAMALLKPGWEKDYEGAPAIHEIVCVGKIVEDAKLEDGRYNIVLLGLSRARILEEVGKGPYRVARVEVLEEKASDEKRTGRKRRVLFELYAAIMRTVNKGAVPVPPDDVPLGMLVDLVVPFVVKEPGVKQQLLERLDPEERYESLMERLGVPERIENPPRPKVWPRGPSLN